MIILHSTNKWMKKSPKCAGLAQEIGFWLSHHCGVCSGLVNGTAATLCTCGKEKSVIDMI
jgi:hypothetical protein